MAWESFFLPAAVIPPRFFGLAATLAVDAEADNTPLAGPDADSSLPIAFGGRPV
jgi:hypothetical protein